MSYNQIFYAKRNNKIVACKFESLHFWYDSFAEKQVEAYPYARTSYTLKFADGHEENGYHKGFPSISNTIDDCLSNVFIPKPSSTITDEIFTECLGFVPEVIEHKSILGTVKNYYAWMWNGYEPVYKPIGSMDGGACRSTCWYNALTRKFENRKWYQSREECAKDNSIEVVNF